MRPHEEGVRFVVGNSRSKGIGSGECFNFLLEVTTFEDHDSESCRALSLRLSTAAEEEDGDLGAAQRRSS